MWDILSSASTAELRVWYQGCRRRSLLLRVKVFHLNQRNKEPIFDLSVTHTHTLERERGKHHHFAASQCLLVSKHNNSLRCWELYLVAMETRKKKA